MTKSVRVFVLLLIGAGCYVGRSGSTAPVLSAPLAEHPPVLELVDFESRVFGNTRKLRILLPGGYSDSRNANRTYPVLYLNDGQNLFDSTTSVFNPMEWRVDETTLALTTAGRIPPIIVVGVDNGGRHARFKEYFPYFDEYLDPPEPDPQGRRYPDFMVDEVMPFVEASYRVSRDPKDRGIGGSSAGGLAAIYAAVARPGTFGKLLVESPSIYVDSAHILRDAERVAQWPERVYLGAGTNEFGQPNCDPAATTESELITDIKRFERLLLRAPTPPRIKFVVTPCGQHNEAAWAARLPEALVFLFDD